MGQPEVQRRGGRPASLRDIVDLRSLGLRHIRHAGSGRDDTRRLARGLARAAEVGPYAPRAADHLLEFCAGGSAPTAALLFKRAATERRETFETRLFERRLDSFASARRGESRVPEGAGGEPRRGDGGDRLGELLYD